MTQPTSLAKTGPQSLIPTTRFLPYLALVFGIVGLGFSAIFVKWANAPGAVSGFYRVAIAAGVMALPAGAQARRRAPLSRRHLALAVLAGIAIVHRAKENHAA